MRTNYKNISVVQVDNSYFDSLAAGIPINPFASRGSVGATALRNSTHYVRSVQYIRTSGSPTKHIPHRVIGSDDLLRISIGIVKATFRDAANLISDYEVLIYNSRIIDTTICGGAAYTIILYYADIWNKKLGHTTKPEMSDKDYKKVLNNRSKVIRCLNIIFNAGPKLFFEIVKRDDFTRIMDFITLHYAVAFKSSSATMRGKYISIPGMISVIRKFIDRSNRIALPHEELSDAAFQKIIDSLVFTVLDKFKMGDT